MLASTLHGIRFSPRFCWIGSGLRTLFRGIKGNLDRIFPFIEHRKERWTSSRNGLLCQFRFSSLARQYRSIWPHSAVLPYDKSLFKMYLADLGIFGRLIIGSRDALQPATPPFGILKEKEKRSFSLSCDVTAFRPLLHGGYFL